MLDGPQAWKSRSNGLEHFADQRAATEHRGENGPSWHGQAAQFTGPSPSFCLDVYDALCRRGWRRLATREHPVPYRSASSSRAIRHAAWKSLGLKPLPSKRRANVSDLAEAFGALRSLIPSRGTVRPITISFRPSVGGLPGLALEERNTDGARIVGTPPRARRATGARA